VPKIKPREGIKKRFIQAVEYISKDNYPQVLQAGIIKKIGMAPSNFYTMRSGSASYPTLDQCYSLCTEFGISAEWLITGHGLMKAANNKQTDPVKILKQVVQILETRSVNKIKK
jgi:hypothetical protein